MPPSALSIAPLWPENRQARLLNWPPPSRVVGLRKRLLFLQRRTRPPPDRRRSIRRLGRWVECRGFRDGAARWRPRQHSAGGDGKNCLAAKRPYCACRSPSARTAAFTSVAPKQHRQAALRCYAGPNQWKTRGRSGLRYRQVLRTGGTRIVDVTVRQPGRHCTKSALRSRSPREKPGLGPGRARPAGCPGS